MDSQKAAILVVDDDPGLCEILIHILQLEGHQAESAGTGKNALERIRKSSFELVILDLKLPDANGLEILSAIRKRNPPLPVIMISGEGDIRTALKATRMGAFDFLEKPLDPDRVLLTVKNALERNRLERAKTNLLESVKEHYVMIGSSPRMQKVHDLIVKAARTTSKVLIEGENGTGKELVARAIHHASPKADRPFVAVNCAAIPDTLIESELFGHKRGAFTGAFADKPGRFRAADGGTLFLDEIGDMSPMTQAKVLRALEEGAIETVGSGSPVSVDVRLISATNKDLRKEMLEGKFREDLFFRINVLNIKLPPLRERREDVPPIVEHYVRHFCYEHGIVLKHISPSAMEKLTLHPWPGNIRELKNFVEKMVVLVESNEISREAVQALLREGVPRRLKEDDSSLTLHEAKERFEREFIRGRLEAAGWNVTQAAERLDIPRTYLYKKMKEMGLGKG